MAALLFVGILLTMAVYHGVILLNNPSKMEYPIRGVDVSSYQGEINWSALAEQDIQFAFIKATEGSSHVDSHFHKNYGEAAQTGLRVGAYHFFSYDSPGEIQAKNFISNVYLIPNMLPPVVDVEFYGDKEKNLPDAQQVEAQLSILLNMLEEHYGLKPIIYATEKSYGLYIKGYFDEYDLWIRSVYRKPALPAEIKWTFWQYTNRAQLMGYAGQERFIDMNVFSEGKEVFQKYQNNE